MSNPYFQFPLCLLAFGTDPLHRLNHVIDWCLVEVGTRLASGIQVCELQWKIGDPRGFSERADWQSGEHLIVLLAMQALQIFGGDLPDILERAAAVEDYCEKLRCVHGEWPTVRIKADHVFNALDGAMTYREFSVLAAISCALGDSPG